MLEWLSALHNYLIYIFGFSSVSICFPYWGLTPSKWRGCGNGKNNPVTMPIFRTIKYQKKKRSYSGFRPKTRVRTHLNHCNDEKTDKRNWLCRIRFPRGTNWRLPIRLEKFLSRPFPTGCITLNSQTTIVSVTK